MGNIRDVAFKLNAGSIQNELTDVLIINYKEEIKFKNHMAAHREFLQILKLPKKRRILNFGINQ